MIKLAIGQQGQSNIMIWAILDKLFSYHSLNIIWLSFRVLMDNSSTKLLKQKLISNQIELSATISFGL
jgi:hypothetical protein